MVWWLSLDNLIILQVQVNKKNLIEFLLDFLHYLYNYYMVCALLSHGYHVTLLCDITWLVTVTCHFPTPEKKRNKIMT